MKHCVEVENNEIHDIGDIWIEEIFPHLYTEGFLFWLPLRTVSLKWYSMISQIKELIITPLLSNYEPLTTIFPHVTKMSAPTFILPLLSQFGLKTLTLPYGNTQTMWFSKSLTSITSLTIGRGVSVANVCNLPNLTHLSMMYIDNYNCHQYHYRDEVPSLKRLHLGRNRCSRGTGADLVELVKYVPLCTLEYLECDDLSVFLALRYTGRGRVHYSYQIVFYYEGEWLEGERHGKGTLVHKKQTCTGIWVNNDIRNGVITNRGEYYEGDIIVWYDQVIVPHGIGRKEWLEGKVKMIYEGSFSHGLLHGKGTLYRDDIIERIGEWELEEEV
jgi:hypothetical protein